MRIRNLCIRGGILARSVQLTIRIVSYFVYIILSLSSSFSLCQGWGAARNFFTASSDSLFHPHLYLVFFFQSFSSLTFLTSVLTEFSHLRIGLLVSWIPWLHHSALVCPRYSIAIFRTKLFSHICSLCCCSSIIANVSVPNRHADVIQVLMTLPFNLFEVSRSAITPQLLSTRSFRPVLFDIHLSPSSRLRTLPFLQVHKTHPLRLQTACLRLKLEKCTFIQKSFLYPGHRLDAEGIHPTNEKSLALQQAPIPTCVTELRRTRELLSQVWALYWNHCMNYYSQGLFTRAIFGLFVARHRDWRRRPTVTRHPKRRRGGCRLKWDMSQCLLKSDTVIYEAATQCPVDELVTCLSPCLSPQQRLSVPSQPISRSLEDAPSLEPTIVDWATVV